MATITEISSPIYVRSEDMLKPPQAAAKLGICKSHLRELSIAGKIPAIDLGRGDRHMFRYHAPTLDAWVAKKMLEKTQVA